MFTKTSRYYRLKTVSTTVRGRNIRAVKLRRLPGATGGPVTIRGSDSLDVMSERLYRDGTRFWHIGDANTEMEANNLVRTTGRTIQVPEK